MKRKIKRHYRSAVSVLLSVCMLISCMTVGLIATDAARVTDSVGASASADGTVGATVSKVVFKVFSLNDVSDLKASAEMTSENTAVDLTVPSTSTYYSLRTDVTYSDNSVKSFYQDVNNDSNFNVPEWMWMKTSRSGAFRVGGKFANKNMRIFYQSENGSQIQIHTEKKPDKVDVTLHSLNRATASVTQGDVTVEAGSTAEMASGADATLSVSVNDYTNYKVTGATYTAGGSTSTIPLTNNEDGTYAGTFRVPTEATTVDVTVAQRVFYDVTTEKTGEGTLTVSKQSCEQGDEVVVTAVPGDDYRLARLTYRPGGDSAIDIKSAKKFRMPGKNVLVSAEFVQKVAGDFVYGATGEGHGTVSAGKQYSDTTNMISETVSSGAGVGAIPDGTKVNLCAIPDVGYSFEGWYESADGASQLSDQKDVTVTIGEDSYTWYAKFVPLAENGYTNVYFSEAIVGKDPEYAVYGWRVDNTIIYGPWESDTLPKISGLPKVEFDGKTYYKLSVSDSQLESMKFNFIVKNGSTKLGGNNSVDKGGAHYVNLNADRNGMVITTTYPAAHPVEISTTGELYGEVGVVAYAQEGDSVTVIASSRNVGKAAAVTCKDGSNSTVAVQNKVFTMPASVAKVNVSYTDVATYRLTYDTVGIGTLTVRCNGNIIESGSEVAVNSNVDFVAAPGVSYYFSGWSGTGDCPSGSAESATKKITQDTHVIATFSQTSYKIVNAPNVNSPSKSAMKLLDNGYVRTTDKWNNGYWFTIEKIESGTEGVYASSFKDGVQDDTSYAQEISDSKPGYPYEWATALPVKHCFRCATDGYIFYDPSTGKIWMSDDPKGVTGVTVIAKDGSFADASPGESDDHSIRYGSTVLKINGSADGVTTDAYGDRAQTYSDLTADDMKEGTTEITVTTTVNNDYKADYLVAGFDVNGQTFFPEDSSGPSYTATFKLSDIKSNTAGYIEITPIYMLKDESDDNRTTRFYVRSFSGDVKSRWGGTLYCYSYKSDQGHNYGSWPGQPMINLGGGNYYIDVPTNTVAITLSNAAADWVHATTMGIILDDAVSDTWKNRNRYQCQSYDYDDFKYIKMLMEAQSTPDEDIIFDFKYKAGEIKKAGKDNFPALWSQHNSSNPTTYKQFPATLTASEISSGFSQWEDYTNYYGENIDLWGNKITVHADVKNPVRVVSQGYYDTYGANSSYYSTAFLVYKPDDWYSDNPSYSLVDYTKGSVYGDRSRSEFLASVADSTYSGDKMAVAKQELANYPVKISYEYSLYECFTTKGTENGSNQYADRCDGVWYYSTSTTVKAKIKIQYADKKSDKFVDDVFPNTDPAEYDYDGEVFKQNVGTVTKASAFFVDNNYTGKYRDPNIAAQIRPVDPPHDVSYTGRVKEWAYTDGYDKYDITAQESEDGVYSFIGWWKVSGNTEEFITSDYNYQIEVTNDETFIARYVKTPAGELKLLHNVHNSNEGDGYRTIKYSVKKNGSEIPAKSGEVRQTGNAATGSLRVPGEYIQFGKGYVITVTFEATPEAGYKNSGLYATASASALLTKSNFETATKQANTADGDSFTFTANSLDPDSAGEETNKEIIEIDVDKLFASGEGYEDGDADHKVSLIQLFSAFGSTPEHEVSITKNISNDDFLGVLQNRFSYFPISVQIKAPGDQTFRDYNDELSGTNYDETLTVNAPRATFTGVDNSVITVHSIRQGDTLNIPNLENGTEVIVTELMPSHIKEGTGNLYREHFRTKYQEALDNYTFAGITAVNRTIADPVTAEANDADHSVSFTVNNDNVDVTISNSAILYTVVVKKEFYDFDYVDTSEFDLKMEYNPTGSNTLGTYHPVPGGTLSQTLTSDTAKTGAGGYYTVERDGTVTFTSKIPKGTLFKVTESRIGDSNITHSQRFELHNMIVDHGVQVESFANGRAFRVGGNDVDKVINITVQNKVKKSWTEITKFIGQGDTETKHYLKLNVMENGSGTVPLGTITYRNTKSTDAATNTVEANENLPIVGGQSYYLYYPIGSYITVEEVQPGTEGYKIESIHAENIVGTADYSKTYEGEGSDNKVGFQTMDNSTATVTITNMREVEYRIDYVFPGRAHLIGDKAGTPKYGSDLTYSVTGKGKPSSVLEADFQSIRGSIVQKNTPYEKNFMQNITWDYPNTEYGTEKVGGKTIYTARVTVLQSGFPQKSVEFYFPYPSRSYTITDHDGTEKGIIYGPVSDVPDRTDYTTQSFTGLTYQGNPVVYATKLDPNGDEYIANFGTYAAPETSDGKKFLYWSITALNRNDPGTTEEPNYVEVARCYELQFKYTIFDDYRVYAMYEGDVSEGETSGKETDKYTYINFLDYSRNHWNNGNNGTDADVSYPDYEEGDIVWTDFDVSFENGYQLICTSENTEVGILVEKVQDNLDAGFDLDPKKSAYKDNYKHYVDKYSETQEQILEWKAAADTFLKTNDSKDAAGTYSRQIIKKTDLTNKGRTEYGYGLFVRNRDGVQETKKNALYRAHSYIKIKDGETSSIILCETPVYFCVKNEANKTKPETNE